MIEVTLYSKENCPLCDEAEEALQTLRSKWEFQLTKKNIYEDDTLLELYQLRIPVIEVNGQIIAEGIIDEVRLSRDLEKIIKSSRQ